MQVYIDESGSPGVKSGPGATEFFTVALVIFDESAHATAAELCLAGLRHELRLPPAFEFHFNDAKARTREAFFRAIGPLPFAYLCATIDKAGTAGTALAKPGPFYRHACGLAFELAEPLLHDATVTLDATGGRVFRETLRTHLLRLANGQKGSKIVRRLHFADSAGNSLVQFADMVCGAVHRSFSAKADAAAYRKLIAHRELACRLWP